MMMPVYILLLQQQLLPAASAAASIQWEKPLLLAQSTGTGSNKSHAWFPEGGCVLGGVRGPQAVIGAVRYCGDGGPPIPGHNDESFASFDGGRSYTHLSFTSFVSGTPTFLDAAGTLHGISIGKAGRSADNRSFTGTGLRYEVLPNRTITRTSTDPVVYRGFPSAVQGLTYMSRMVNLSSDSKILVQAVGFSPTTNETPESLAAFRSTDGGSHWDFQQVRQHFTGYT
jgi:hypothetical protein